MLYSDMKEGIVSKEDYNIIIDTIIKDLNNSNKNLINILNKKAQSKICAFI